jgi:hypothetical protein
MGQDPPALDGRIGRLGAANAQTAGRDATQAAIHRYPLQGKTSLAQLVRLTLNEGLLDVQAASDMPAEGQPVRVEVEGSDATWVVLKRSAGKASTYVTLSWYDFSAADDEFWQAAVTIRDNYVSLSAQTGNAASGVRVRLTQSAKRLRLLVTDAQPGGARRQVFSASADSVDQLRRENPEQVRKYLEPPLRKITGRSLLKPGPADVYAVFENIRPDPAVARLVMRLLIQLDAESFKQREEASQALAKLGPPAVLAVMRLDRSMVSAEVNTRLATFLAAGGNSTLDPRQAAKDPHFLIDCLDDDDPKVRAAAQEALEKMLNQPVTFDLSLTGEERLKAVDGVRKQLSGKISADGRSNKHP